MEKIPSNLRYSKEHEWVLTEDDVLTIGITHHAQCQLGDVVYIELPEVGRKITKDKVFGVVESVKAVSDLFAPISGQVLEVNANVIDKPEGINENPYEGSWMIKLRPENISDLADLMDADHYKIYLADLAK